MVVWGRDGGCGRSRLTAQPAAHRSLRALAISWVGVGLNLAFYGVETFGLSQPSAEKRTTVAPRAS